MRYSRTDRHFGDPAVLACEAIGHFHGPGENPADDQPGCPRCDERAAGRLTARERAQVNGQPVTGHQRDPSITANVPGSNALGPSPYDDTAGAGAECPSCHRGIPAGSVYCDQCMKVVNPGLAKMNQWDGGVLVSAGSGEAAGDLPITTADVVGCPSCGQLNRREAIACRKCGVPIPESAFAAAMNNAITGPHPKGTSSSGRRPGYRDYRLRVEAATLDARSLYGLRDKDQGVMLSPRAEYLERTGRAPRQFGYTLSERVGEAQDAVEAIADDSHRALKAYANARGDCFEAGVDPDSPALLARRELTREQQHALAVCLNAQAVMARIAEAYDAALARRSRLEEEYSRDSLAAAEAEMTGLAREWHPLMAESEGTMDGLSPIDRARNYR